MITGFQTPPLFRDRRCGIALGTLAIVFVLTGFSSVGASEKVFRLNIPTGSAAEVLDRLAQETGSSLLFRSGELASVTTNALDGSYTVPQALDSLLEGTPLDAVVTGKGVIVVSLAPGVQQNNNIGRSDMSGKTSDSDKKVNSKKNILALLFGFLVGAGGDPGVVAWADSAVIEEVIVTAQRRAENLQKVPISITAVDAGALDRANVTSIADLGILAPSLNFVAEAALAKPHLRGIGTPATGPGIESPVAIYIDGVYQAAMVGGASNFQNIKAVEVINGPQGTLYGRNATGGLIHIRTLDPSFEFSGNASVGYGNYDAFSSSAYVTGPLSETVAANLSLDFSDQAEGYGRNLVTGEEVDESRSVFARAKILFLPSDSVSFTLAGNYADVEFDPLSPPAPGSTPFGGNFPLKPHQYGSTQDYRGDLDQFGLSLTADFDLDWVGLQSITAFQSIDSSTLYGDLTNNPDAAVNTLLDEPHRQFSQEFQLSSSSEGAFTWTAGLYYFHETARYDPVHLFGPLYELDGLSDIFVNTKTVTDSYSGYGQGTYRLTESTRVTAGVRHTVDTRETEIVERDVVIDVGTFVFQTRVKETWRKPTWRLSLDHDFSPDVLGYVSYNRGFKSGGMNTSRIPTEPFEPEKLDAYEVGLKTQLADRRVRFNLAGFFYQYEQLQTQSYPNEIILISNGAEAELYGLDADLQVVVTENLDLRVGLSWLHAEFTDFPDASLAIPLLPEGGNAYGTTDAEGNRLPHAPKTVITTGITYDIPTRVGRFVVNANYLYNDGWYAEPDNRLRQKSYSLINSQIGWHSPSEQFEIELWGKNLSDENYFQAMFSQGSGDLIHWAPPRTYGVTAKVNF